jgi:hypothetical protein
MRKVGLLLVVFAMILAFAMPASAWMSDDGKGNKIMIGGNWLTDFGWWNRNKERMASQGAYTSDQTQLMLNVPMNTTLRGYVESGNAGGFFELGLGTTSNQATGISPGVDMRKMYGYYKFGNCQILAGKNDGWLYSLVPQQRLGANLLTVWAFGFGNFYDGRFAQVRFTQDVSKQFRYAISLVANQPTAETFAGASKTSYAQIPTLAAKFTLNFGVVTLYPALGWSQFKWDNLPSGFDDSVTAYYAVLPVKVVAGPFTGLVQMGFGQNIGNMLNPGSLTTMGGNTSPYQVYQRMATGKVKNTQALNGFIDLGYTFGPVTPHLMFGFDNAKNGDAWTTGDNSNTRMWWGASLNWSITPNFMIVPEISVYDFGTRPGTAGAPNIGKDWMAGAQFVFAF